MALHHGSGRLPGVPIDDGLMEPVMHFVFVNDLPYIDRIRQEVVETATGEDQTARRAAFPACPLFASDAGDSQVLSQIED